MRHGIATHPGQALRVSAIAFGSALLIAALTFELYALALTIAAH